MSDSDTETEDVEETMETRTNEDDDSNTGENNKVHPDDDDVVDKADEDESSRKDDADHSADNEIHYQPDEQEDLTENEQHENQKAHQNDENTDAEEKKTYSRHDEDERKLFVGGLGWEVTQAEFREYFEKFGTVVDCTLKTDPTTGRSRGFGFIVFDDISAIDKVIGEKNHKINGRTIDPKKAMTRNRDSGATNESRGDSKEPIRKVFVGGISPDLPESEIREYFSKFGKIEELEMPFDKMKNQRRAFCFIQFETEEIAEQVCTNAKQTLGGKEVDVRKATPRSDQDGGRGGRGGFNNRGRGRGYGAPGAYGQPDWSMGGYDYSAYYNQPYGYPYGYSYPGYPGYDYSAYYGQDWSQYGQAYPGYDAYAQPYSGYDYSQWYGADPAQGAAATAQAPGGKVKSSVGAAAPFHPYSR